MQSEIQRNLGIFSDSKLDFKRHKQNVHNKVSKTIGLLCQLRKMLPTPLLIAIYISFTRPHLDYGDIICNEHLTFPLIRSWSYKRNIRENPLS